MLRTWEGNELDKSLKSSFTSYSSSTKEIQSRMILTLIQANGFPLTEIAVRNTDGTSWTRDTFTSFSKSLTEELRFTQKDKFS